jgi:two-component system cell cycle sensor histidine kinase/response regulator CckA
MVRNLMVKALVRENHMVWEANGAAEALQVSEEFRGTLDLLITDLNLNTITGRQVAEQIRQSQSGMKTLFISKYLIETLVREGAMISGADLLAKPFSATDLTQKVGQVLLNT